MPNVLMVMGGPIEYIPASATEAAITMMAKIAFTSKRYIAEHVLSSYNDNMVKRTAFGPFQSKNIPQKMRERPLSKKARLPIYVRNWSVY